MTSIYITAHAVERWIERVQPAATFRQAETAILAHAPALEKAVAFGCRTVRIRPRVKLCLRGHHVTTVLVGCGTSSGHHLFDEESAQ